MDILSIIEHKRDKKELSKNEIEYFVEGYTKGDISDNYAETLIKSIYLNGMSKEETVNLTMAMANSGEKLDLSDISDIIVDKHSTGGVGDKITIILMPIIASLGVPVAKMSGRGLGFTGGTADKLESIPGYKVDIPIAEFKHNIRKIGISLITSNAELAPADKKIYALRDAIGCVSSIPLIASSIMSKKIAAGANKILIDITCGNGAFMKDIDKAKELASLMMEIGQNINKEVRCIITNMDEPVGYSVGNQLEIIESVNALKGKMSKDVEEIVYVLGTEILLMAKKANSENEAELMIKNAIESGKAFEKFKELVENQNGDISYIEDTNIFKSAKYIISVPAIKTGKVSKIETEEIGKVSAFIGAGRVMKEDKIDYQTGIIINKKIGTSVAKDESVAILHINNKDKIDDAVKKVQEAFIISDVFEGKSKTVIQTIK